VVILLKEPGAFASGCQCPGTVALFVLSAPGDVLGEGVGLGEVGDRGGVGGDEGIFLSIVAYFWN
jgi:hypothetical protein